MKRRDFLMAAGALAASPASPAFAQAPAAGPVRVRIFTSQGAIVLELAADKAPLTCANFLKYVDGTLYDGARFYRAMRTKWAPETGIVQGGLQNDASKLLPPVAHESTTQTGLAHKDGTISMARYEPGSATSDFFICCGDAAYLDANPAATGDNLGFAAFGRVVEGMDIARRILVMPTSPTLGEGVMLGQMLEPPVSIVAARRI
jgi:peptidyl-prolyl cis-trans isomerase A (cyclophilin A)